MAASCPCASLCINCANIWTPTGFTASNCLGSTLYSGNQSAASQTNASASGTYTEAVTTPALNGLCISACATVITVGSTAGVVIANGPYLFARNALAYGLQSLRDANGCAAGGSAFSSFGSNFVSGDVITLQVNDSSSGAGTYTVTCYVNGTLVKTLTGQAYTFTAGSPNKVGYCDTNGGTWTNLIIATS